jgi:hypothetical protein
MWAALAKAFFSAWAEVAKLWQLDRTLEAGQAEAKVESLNDYVQKEAVADAAIGNVDSVPIEQDPANRATKRKRKVRAVQ